MRCDGTDLERAQAMRVADCDSLSLALMQSRNRLLAWLALFESADAARARAALWLAGRTAWEQEHGMARSAVSASADNC